MAWFSLKLQAAWVSAQISDQKPEFQVAGIQLALEVEFLTLKSSIVFVTVNMKIDKFFVEIVYSVSGHKTLSQIHLL